MTVKLVTHASAVHLTLKWSDKRKTARERMREGKSERGRVTV